MITKNGFENFKIYNICPENASIKFDKRDKKKPVQDSNPRATNCLPTLQSTELGGYLSTTVQLKAFTREKKLWYIGSTLSQNNQYR